MKPQHLVKQIVFLVLMMFVSNLGIAWFAKNSVPRQVLRKAQASTNATDLFFGNSLVQAGIDESVYEAPTNRRAANLGLGASSSNEHLVLFLNCPGIEVRNIYYGFFDTQLTDIPATSWTSLNGNRALAYYANPEVTSNAAWENGLNDYLSFHTVRLSPMLVERTLIWSKVELLRRTIGSLGIRSETYNRFGRVEDFRLLETEDTTFKTKCKELAQTEIVFAPAVRRILSASMAQRAKRCAICMPMPRAHRNKYYSLPEWKAYLFAIRTKLYRDGVDLIDASDWIDDGGFDDPLHLNAQGAARFSEKLLAVTP